MTRDSSPSYANVGHERIEWVIFAGMHLRANSALRDDTGLNLPVEALPFSPFSFSLSLLREARVIVTRYPSFRIFESIAAYKKRRSRPFVLTKPRMHLMFNKRIHLDKIAEKILALGIRMCNLFEKRK